MTHGSLFSGIGGFDLAAEWMGWENVFHCEINTFGQRVLKYYWPKAISYDDITKTDFTIHRGTIDILTGGFPCQPFSLAGKRLGTEDHRNLWPEYFRAIKEIQPTWVVGENVPGLLNWSNGLVFEQVQADLENEGYEVWPVILPACSVNAPHKRERVWFVAYSEGYGNSGIKRMHDNKQSSNKEENGQRFRYKSNNNVEIQFIANPNGSKRCERGLHSSRPIKATRYSGSCDARNFGRPTWDNFPTQPPVRSRNDGIPSGLVGITVSKHRNESIKAYGNAIVPQVVYQIFKAINQFNP